MSHYQSVLKSLSPVVSDHKATLIKRLSATQTSLINAEGYCDGLVLDGIKKDFDQALESLYLVLEDLTSSPAGICQAPIPGAEMGELDMADYDVTVLGDK